MLEFSLVCQNSRERKVMAPSTQELWEALEGLCEAHPTRSRWPIGVYLSSSQKLVKQRHAGHRVLYTRDEYDLKVHKLPGFFDLSARKPGSHVDAVIRIDGIIQGADEIHTWVLELVREAAAVPTSN